MNIWPIQEAKAHFSQLIKTCRYKGPQFITCRGEEAAVIIPMNTWKRLSSATSLSIKDLLLAQEGCRDLNIPSRGKAKRRAVKPI